MYILLNGPNNDSHWGIIPWRFLCLIYQTSFKHGFHKFAAYRVKFCAYSFES